MDVSEEGDRHDHLGVRIILSAGGDPEARRSSRFPRRETRSTRKGANSNIQDDRRRRKLQKKKPAEAGLLREQRARPRGNQQIRRYRRVLPAGARSSRITRSRLSLRNSVPSTRDISATMIGYQRP